MRNQPRICAERFPFRYTDNGVLPNGCGDFRIQVFDENTKRYRDFYLCDNKEQMMLAIEDIDYAKWLHGGMPCYIKNNVKNPNS